MSKEDTYLKAANRLIESTPSKKQKTNPTKSKSKEPESVKKNKKSQKTPVEKKSNQAERHETVPKKKSITTDENKQLTVTIPVRESSKNTDILPDAQESPSYPYPVTLGDYFIDNMTALTNIKMLTRKIFALRFVQQKIINDDAMYEKYGNYYKEILDPTREIMVIGMTNPIEVRCIQLYNDFCKYAEDDLMLSSYLFTLKQNFDVLKRDHPIFKSA
jgi:hypothetical protein